MNLSLRRRLRPLLPAILMVLALSLCLTGCVREESIEIQEPVDEVQPYAFSFEVSVASPADAATRAAQEDYEPGNEWENYIHLSGNDFRVLFFSHNPYVDDADFYLGSLEDVTLSLLAETPAKTTYKVNGSIKPDIATEMEAGNVKIAVFANWSAYYNLDAVSAEADKVSQVGRVTLSDVWENAEFDFRKTLDETAQTQYPLRLNNLIPLYGVSNPLGKVRFDGNRYFHAGTVHMLRAYAKVEVVQSEGSIEIDEVRLRRYNLRGYYLPFSYRTLDDYLKGNYEGDYGPGPHVPAGNSSVSETTITFSHAENNRWYLYIPEYANVGRPDREQTCVEVKFRDYDHYETLHFSRYRTDSDSEVSQRGADFDICRNNLYRFRIFKDLNVQVDVIPYTAVELNPDFGFDEPLPRPPQEGEMPPWIEVSPE